MIEYFDITDIVSTDDKLEKSETTVIPLPLESLAGFKIHISSLDSGFDEEISIFFKFF